MTFDQPHDPHAFHPGPINDCRDASCKALVCALCLYMEDGRKANIALTVIEGYAVCDDHLGYVAQGQHFHSLITAIRREETVTW